MRRFRCSHCGHRNAGNREVCLYCGAPTGPAPAPPTALPAVEPGDRGNSGKTGEEPENRNPGGVTSSSPFDPPIPLLDDPKVTEAYLLQQLAILKSRRRAPLSKGLQAALFFLAMLLGGLMVWLFR